MNFKNEEKLVSLMLDDLRKISKMVAEEREFDSKEFEQILVDGEKYESNLDELRNSFVLENINKKLRHCYTMELIHEKENNKHLTKEENAYIEYKQAKMNVDKSWTIRHDFNSKNFTEYMKLVGTLISNINAFREIDTKNEYIDEIESILENELNQCKYFMDYSMETKSIKHFRCLNITYLDLLKKLIDINKVRNKIAMVEKINNR